MATEISNEPNSIPLVIVQGDPLSFTVTITDAATDFTGYAGRGKIVTSFAALTLVVALTVTVSSAINGSMVVVVSLTAAQTAGIANITAGERRQSIGVYDIEVHSGLLSLRIMQGGAVLSRQATT